MSSASVSQTFSSLTLSKLHLSVSSKGTCSLHRWVLLKNSIHLSSSITSNASSSSSQSNSTQYNDESESDDDFFHHLHPSVSYGLEDPDEEDDSEEVLGSSHINSFMFPDAGKLLSVSESSGTSGSEAQWLDSLLETLADDDDDDFTTDSDNSITNIPVDDDDFSLYSPLASPLSSSDDLPSQSSAFYPSSSSVQYPSISYSSYHQPSCSFNITFIPSISEPNYEHPLPYHDNDIEDLSVPDAIEDTSDDESDAPTTASLGRSSTSLSDGDSSSTQSAPSTPPQPSRLRHPSLLVYDHNDSNIISFEIDPLPFPDQHHNPSYNFYDEEC